jgi:phosphoglucomutase
VRPSGTEPKLKTYVTVSAPDKAAAEVIEKKIVEDLKKRING